jgi:hypothetical protein
MPQTGMHAADTTAGLDREQWPALLVCLAGGFVVFLDVSIVDVALPTISSHLHASGSGLQWVVSGWARLAPVRVAGLGGGMVVAPNQSLSLSAVPLSRAGTAAGRLQTGQRIGASIGIAAAGSAFFSTLRGHGSFADAYRNGIFVTSGLTTAALLLALIDRHRGRHARDETV